MHSVHSRMQTMLASAQTKRPTMFSVIRSSIAEAGVRSLYTGLSASLLRQMTYSLVRLGSFEPIKASLSSDGPPSPATTFLAAMLAGALGGMAGNPAGESPQCPILSSVTHTRRPRCRVCAHDKRLDKTARTKIRVLECFHRCCQFSQGRRAHGPGKGSRHKSREHFHSELSDSSDMVDLIRPEPF